MNFGSLGFLTEIQLDELYDSLESVLDGEAKIDERMMLRARTLRDGGIFADRLVVNDVVITKAALSRIIDLSVTIGDQLVMRVRADGLIVATPTGSSAYNLAAGGPIVHPAVDALLLTPIAPHMLTNRPVVLPGSSEVRVEPMMNGGEEVYVTFDGQSGHPLQADDVIEITRAERPLRLVRASKRTYFDVLRQKLKWGARVSAMLTGVAPRALASDDDCAPADLRSSSAISTCRELQAQTPSVLAYTTAGSTCPRMV